MLESRDGTMFTDKRRIGQGVVRRFDADKGVGEIEAENGAVFAVHRSALRDEALSGIFAGDIVEFRVGRNRFGRPAALEVRRIGWEDEEDEGGAPREWTF